MKLPMFLRKDKKQCVKTFEVKFHRYQVQYVGYIHCFESLKGKRTVELGSTSDMMYDSLRETLVNSPTYQTRIVRWLSGRRDTEIPIYSEINEVDTVNALRNINE